MLSKQRFVAVISLLVIILPAALASCAPAATAPTTPSSPTAAATPTTDNTTGIPSSISIQRQRTSGTISKIDGNALTLTTSQGTVNVTINPQSTIILDVKSGAISDLKVGAYVMAIGQQDGSGNIAATSVMVRSPSQSVAPTSPEGAPPATSSSPRPGARRGASGTISDVKGNVLTLTTTQGTITVTVSSENTTVQTAMAATPADFRTGQSLNVSGPPDASGNVNASFVMILPPAASTPAPK